jgi:hypothetical protein
MNFLNYLVIICFNITHNVSWKLDPTNHYFVDKIMG